MAKKTFAVTRAHLVTGRRWYIDFTTVDLSTGALFRRRQDFDLNDIADTDIRRLVGERLVKHLSVFVEIAQKATPAAPTNKAPAIPLAAAVQQAIAIKISGIRKNTHKTYRSVGGIFLEWAKSRSYSEMPLPDFEKKHCRAFFDYLKTRKAYRGCTINNYLMHLKIMWGELVEREMCPDNPWKSLKQVREEEKIRRVFSPEERRIVAQEVEKTDYWLFRGLLLQFFCYVRPVELCRLKFRNFHLNKGLLKIDGNQAKSWVDRWITIPAAVLPYFQDGCFDQQPANYFVFGTGVQPGPTAVSDHRMYRRHRNILERLRADGRLRDITGLSWYSWKDTGISMHSRATSLLSTKDQAGHTSTDMTLRYYHSEQINPEYQGLENDLFL